MNRRQFISLAGTTGMGALATDATRSPATASSVPPPAPSPSGLMKVGTQQGPVTAPMLQYFKRHGVTHLCASPPRAAGGWRLDEFLSPAAAALP